MTKAELMALAENIVQKHSIYDGYELFPLIEALVESNERLAEALNTIAMDTTAHDQLTSQGKQGVAKRALADHAARMEKLCK